MKQFGFNFHLKDPVVSDDDTVVALPKAQSVIFFPDAVVFAESKGQSYLINLREEIQCESESSVSGS